MINAMTSVEIGPGETCYVYGGNAVVVVQPQHDETGNADTSSSGDDASSNSGNDTASSSGDVGSVLCSEPLSSSTDDEEKHSEDGEASKVRQPYDDEFIRQKLAVRAYHLPGNSWCEDWQMYIKNNHLVLGLCLHHPLHPVTLPHRIVLLLGSLAFGLVVTNVVFLWGDMVDEAALTGGTLESWENVLETLYNETEFLLMEQDIDIRNVKRNVQTTLKLDASQLSILWTLGSSVHSAFDFGLWHMIACGHCRQTSCAFIGWFWAMFVVIILVSVTSVMVYQRATRLGEGDEFGGVQLPEQNSTFFDKAFAHLQDADFSFLLAYIIEVGVSLFIFSPIVMTTVFSGILGCGRLPFLGGRPRSVRIMSEQTLSKNEQAQSREEGP